MVQKLCRTCRHWNFKVSTEKAWGRCLNEKVHGSTYISAQIPQDIKSVEEFHNWRKWVTEYCEIYFEENTFGCIHYEQFIKG